MAATISNKVLSDGLDYIVSLALAWVRAVDVKAGMVTVRLTSGEVLRGRLGEGWTTTLLELVGALEDLMKAYKQCAWRPSQQCFFGF